MGEWPTTEGENAPHPTGDAYFTSNNYFASAKDGTLKQVDEAEDPLFNDEGNSIWDEDNLLVYTEEGPLTCEEESLELLVEEATGSILLPTLENLRANENVIGDVEGEEKEKEKTLFQCEWPPRHDLKVAKPFIEPFELIITVDPQLVTFVAVHLLR